MNIDKINKSLSAEQYREYNKIEDIIEYHLDSTLKNLNYQNYDRLKNVINVHERLKSIFFSFFMISYQLCGLHFSVF